MKRVRRIVVTTIIAGSISILSSSIGVGIICWILIVLSSEIAIQIKKPRIYYSKDMSIIPYRERIEIEIKTKKGRVWADMTHEQWDELVAIVNATRRTFFSDEPQEEKK